MSSSNTTLLLVTPHPQMPVGGFFSWIANAFAALLKPLWHALLEIVEPLLQAALDFLLIVLQTLDETLVKIVDDFQPKMIKYIEFIIRIISLILSVFLNIFVQLEGHYYVSEYLVLYVIIVYNGFKFRSALILTFLFLLFLGINRHHMSFVLAFMNPQFRNTTLVSSTVPIGYLYPFSDRLLCTVTRTPDRIYLHYHHLTFSVPHHPLTTPFAFIFRGDFLVGVNVFGWVIMFA